MGNIFVMWQNRHARQSRKDTVFPQSGFHGGVIGEEKGPIVEELELGPEIFVASFAPIRGKPHGLPLFPGFEAEEHIEIVVEASWARFRRGVLSEDGDLFVVRAGERYCNLLPALSAQRFARGVGGEDRGVVKAAAEKGLIAVNGVVLQVRTNHGVGEVMAESSALPRTVDGKVALAAHYEIDVTRLQRQATNKRPEQGLP